MMKKQSGAPQPNSSMKRAHTSPTGMLVQSVRLVNCSAPPYLALQTVTAVLSTMSESEIAKT